jgi:hypothetical protein
LWFWFSFSFFSFFFSSSSCYFLVLFFFLFLIFFFLLLLLKKKTKKLTMRQFVNLSSSFAKKRLHNFFHKNPQEWDLPQKLLKLEGQVMMGDERWQWFPSIPQKPNTHKWASSQNKQKGAMSSSKSSLMNKRKKTREKKDRKKGKKKRNFFFKN